MSNNQMVSVPEGFMLVERSIWTEQQVDSAAACITLLKNVSGMTDRDLAMAAIDAAQCKAPDITLADILPAEQHQGEPVAVVDESDDGLFVELIYGDNGNPLRRGDKLYTHADPAEVERLREQAETLRLMTNDYLLETERLRTQLAERDALLREIHDGTLSGYARYSKIEAVLCASAEPRAPAELEAPELTDDLREILGRPNFTCHFIAKALRVMGHSIAHKSEDEQAVVIHWLLGIYLKHGSDWRQRASAELEEASKALKS